MNANCGNLGKSVICINFCDYLCFICDLIGWSRSDNTSIESRDRYDSLTCKCRKIAPLRTSWTSDNPGRRFWCCPYYGTNHRSCDFFMWKDPETCERGKSFGNKLLFRIKDLEKEIATLKIDQNRSRGNLGVEQDFLSKRCVDVEETNIRLKEELQRIQKKQLVKDTCLVLMFVFLVILIVKGD